MDEKSFLIISNLHKSYGEGENKQEVLKDLNISVNEGEFCVLLGPSGSGKSTLLNIMRMMAMCLLMATNCGIWTTKH